MKFLLNLTSIGAIGTIATLPTLNSIENSNYKMESAINPKSTDKAIKYLEWTIKTLNSAFEIKDIKGRIPLLDISIKYLNSSLNEVPSSNHDAKSTISDAIKTVQRAIDATNLQFQENNIRIALTQTEHAINFL